MRWVALHPSVEVAIRYRADRTTLRLGGLELAPTEFEVRRDYAFDGLALVPEEPQYRALLPDEDIVALHLMGVPFTEE